MIDDDGSSLISGHAPLVVTASFYDSTRTMDADCADGVFVSGDCVFLTPREG